MHCGWYALVALIVPARNTTSAFLPNEGLLTRGASRRHYCRRDRLALVIWSDNNNGNHFSNNDDVLKEEELHRLSEDLDKLKALRPPEPSADFSAPTAIISAGSSYTRLWTHKTWMTHGNPPHLRYSRHIMRWPYSTSAAKILPAVLMSAFYSLVMSLSLKHVHIGSIADYQLGAMTKGASAAMATLSLPLALLLTLRANASLGRLSEARGLWGRLILRGRNLSSVLRTYVMSTNPELAILATRYLSVFAWSIKALVRNESIESQREVYETMLTKDEADWILSQNIKPTLAIILALRHIVADIAVDKDATFFVTHSSLESCINDLDACSGGCERILGSPIPPTYSRHLSRIMVMYLAILPFALVASGTPSLGVVVASAIASYVLIGVDEIGMEVENPFPMMPLQQLSSAFQNAVGEQMIGEQIMIPSIREKKKEDKILQPNLHDLTLSFMHLHLCHIYWRRTMWLQFQLGLNTTRPV
ncbi:hypothetical protein ACHAXR_007125 [Thalassiosira sp. AJA248-18]